jgi:hypothetical protein
VGALQRMLRVTADGAMVMVEGNICQTYLPVMI